VAEKFVRTRQDMDRWKQKKYGAYYTPTAVVQSLVNWTVRRKTDRMLDPACGDGRFLLAHPNSVGVEQDSDAARVVHANKPGSLIHQGEFFAWAGGTCERFECAAGNPPFIRYQRFTGDVRDAARGLCARHGAKFSALSSSWAPFIVATATVLKRGGRMAFVVPAEIGHAPYATPVLDYLAAHFDFVQIVAIEKKLFPQLSEDCWLLYAEGYGGHTDHFNLSPMSQFGFMRSPPSLNIHVSVAEWRKANSRLRTFLLSQDVRDFYDRVAHDPTSGRLGDVAKVGIGYVTGNNSFFHFRPLEADRVGIPKVLLQPTVRSGRMLTGRALTDSTVEAWRRRDEPNFLLRLRQGCVLPSPVSRYLDSAEGQKARMAYKCRTRTPWYVVPGVEVPDGFLSYMSGNGPVLTANRAGCVGTNSVHLVTLKGSMKMPELQRMWRHAFTRLSCEIEGHPLGGGMLKVEPGEAARIVLARRKFCSSRDNVRIREGIQTMQRWRHHG